MCCGDLSNSSASPASLAESVSWPQSWIIISAIWRVNASSSTTNITAIKTPPSAMQLSHSRGTASEQNCSLAWIVVVDVRPDWSGGDVVDGVGGGGWPQLTRALEPTRAPVFDGVS